MLGYAWLPVIRCVCLCCVVCLCVCVRARVVCVVLCVHAHVYGVCVCVLCVCVFLCVHARCRHVYNSIFNTQSTSMHAVWMHVYCVMFCVSMYVPASVHVCADCIAANLQSL